MGNLLGGLVSHVSELRNAIANRCSLRRSSARDVTSMAEALLQAHLPGRGWTFGFDRAVRRAGACHHAERVPAL